MSKKPRKGRCAMPNKTEAAKVARTGKGQKGYLDGFPPKARAALEQHLLIMGSAVHWAMGETPEGRLRWLLSFASEDLTRLSPAERIERGERLRQFHVPNSAVVGIPLGPMPDEILARLHAEIARGIRAVLGEERPDWFVPGPARFAFSRFTARIQEGPKGAKIGPKRMIFHLRWDWGEGQEEAAILAGIIHLLQESGSRLRGCVECGRPFLAVKRQIYCRKECSQRNRNLAKQQPSQAKE